MKKILTFIEMLEEKKYDMKQFMWLYFLWERMDMAKKNALYDSFRAHKPLTDNSFYRQLEAFDKVEGFDVDVFGDLYDYWQSMTERERVSSYGMFYKTGTRKKTGKRYSKDEIMWHEYEIVGEDIDERTKEGPKRAMYYYKCRDCGQRFYASYEQTSCKICGSINIYAFQREQVVGTYEYLYWSNYRDRINEL